MKIHDLSHVYRSMCEHGAAQARHARWLMLPLLIVAASPIGGLAQSTDRETAVAAVKVGESVRLHGARIGRMERAFLATNDRMFSLARNGQRTQVQLSDIERLWVRGRSTGRGAVIGAAVGVIAGIILAQRATRICGWEQGEEEGDRRCSLGEQAAVFGKIAVVVGPVVGAVGAVVGAGIGFSIPTWRLRFP